MLLLEQAQFTDRVFRACLGVVKEGATFTAKEIVSRVAGPGLEGDHAFYAGQNVSVAIQILEHMRLVTGQTRPEYTPILRLQLEVRHGDIGRLGTVASSFPAALRCSAFMIYIQRRRLTAVLGVLAVFRLLSHAYQGAALLAGWLEYAAAMVLLYILYLLIMRTIR